MSRLISGIILSIIFANNLIGIEECSCKEHGRPYNPKNACCGDIEYNPETVERFNFSPNFDAIKTSFDCFNRVQKSICNTSGKVSFSPTLSISCTGTRTCCEEKDVVLLGTITAGGGLDVSIPAIESMDIPIPGTWGIVYFSASIGFSAQLSFSGAMNTTCKLPQGVFTLNGNIGASGGGKLKAISENIASISGSVSALGNCTITYTLPAGEKTGTWSVKECDIANVTVSYSVLVIGFQVSKGNADLI